MYANPSEKPAVLFSTARKCLFIRHKKKICLFIAFCVKLSPATKYE